MGAIVNVYYGPPSKPRLEGQAEVKEVLKYLGDGWYRVRCVFLGDQKSRTRIIQIGKVGESNK